MAALLAQFEENIATPRFKITKEDLVVIKKLGEGAFGKVYLVRHRTVPRVHFAMKVYDKRKVVKQKMDTFVIREKRIASGVECPFFAHLANSYKDNSYVYLLLQCVPGPSMDDYLKAVGRVPDLFVRFYAAQIVLALEYLQTLKIVYRDLKPENMVVDYTGYLKLIDFGFAKELKDGVTATFCGTPQYLAPEVVQRRPLYGFPCDWWSLGVVIYQLMCGRQPFALNPEENDSMTELMVRVGSLVRAPRMPGGMAKDLCKMLTKLLNPDPRSRAGTVRNNRSSLRTDPWFANWATNWNGIYDRTVEPPFIPVIEKLEDIPPESVEHLVISKNDIHPDIFAPF